MELAARYNSNEQSEDGGCLEIVEHNDKTGYTYAVNDVKKTIIVIKTDNIAASDSVTNLAGIKLQPDGTIKVKMPVDGLFSEAPEYIEAYREDSTVSGGYRYIGTYKVNNDTVEFETNHFSTYLFAEVTENFTDTNTNVTAPGDITASDSANIPMIILIGFTALAVGTTIVTKKKAYI